MANEPHFEVYPQKYAPEGRWPPKPTGEFGWRFRAANGQITAIGGEGFGDARDVERAVEQFSKDFDDARGYVLGTVPPILRVDE